VSAADGLVIGKRDEVRRALGLAVDTTTGEFGALVLVKALAGHDAQLALVDVFLLEVRGPHLRPWSGLADEML
jgi:hypothetical protein